MYRLYKSCITLQTYIRTYSDKMYKIKEPNACNRKQQCQV